MVIIALTIVSLMALVVVMAVIRKTPPIRVLLVLGLVLLAVLALGVGNPQMFETVVNAFVTVFSGKAST